MFFKKDVLKYFAKFTGHRETPVPKSLFNIVPGCSPLERNSDTAVFL